MRLHALVLCCATALAIAEDGPHCTGDQLGDVWLADVPRSAERWQAGPYPALIARPWISALTARLQPVWKHLRIDGEHVLAALGDSRCARLTFCRAAGDDGAPEALLDVALRERPASNAFVRIAQGLLPVATRLGEDGPPAWLSGGAEAVLLDGRFVLRSTRQPGPVAMPERTPLPPITADLAMAILPDLLPALATLTDLPLEDLEQPGYGEQRIHFTLEPFGLREHSTQDLAPERATAMEGLRLPAARQELFADLPRDTLFALVARAESATTKALLEAFAPADDQDFKDVDVALVGIGLPDLRSLLRAIDGDVVLRVEPGSPFPVATATIGMTEAPARQLLDALRDRAGYTAREDGSIAGMTGLFTIHAAWRDDRFTITSDPLGLDAALARRGGFTDHQEVRTALAEIAPDALFAAVSRSAPAWDTIGRLALFGLARFKLPGLATMPRDLAAGARFGFLSYAVRDGQVILDAGGLFGGPLCWIGLIGTGTFSAWCALMDESGMEEAMDADAADADL